MYGAGMSEDAARISAGVVARDLRVVFGRLRRRLREVAQADDLTSSQIAVLIRLGKGEVGTASTFAAAIVASSSGV